MEPSDYSVSSYLVLVNICSGLIDLFRLYCSLRKKVNIVSASKNKKTKIVHIVGLVTQA